MSYIKAVLALIQIVSWVMGKLDDAQKEKALAALWEQDFMKHDKELIDEALKARKEIRDLLAAHPDKLRDDDGFKLP